MLVTGIISTHLLPVQSPYSMCLIPNEELKIKNRWAAIKNMCVAFSYDLCGRARAA